MNNVAKITPSTSPPSVRALPRSDWLARAKDLWTEVSEGITDRIKAHPFGSLGVAAGLGILLGASVRSGPGRVAALAAAGRLIRAGLEAKP